MRLQKLVTSRQELEAEVRRLKLQLNDERAARVNGASGQDCESDCECAVHVTANSDAAQHAMQRQGSSPSQKRLAKTYGGSMLLVDLKEYS